MIRGPGPSPEARSLASREAGPQVGAGAGLWSRPAACAAHESVARDQRQPAPRTATAVHFVECAPGTPPGRVRIRVSGARFCLITTTAHFKKKTFFPAKKRRVGIQARSRRPWGQIPYTDFSVFGPEEEALGGGGGGVYSYSMDTIEGPRAPAVKLTARHSSLTRVRAAPLSPW